ncbi:hypothetical protein [Parvimonas parva]|uniref:Uncharacterized protein n=1 Tax=Parvimonas parva TaxID=2769485 RepID=A0ABS1CAY9_9FIRM|nr:hypothetical protein [Parvimonas parva]MBK1468512.1 hypothetical protein [Parvimonas parva]
MALSKIKKSLKKLLFFTLVFSFSAQTLKVQALDDKLETNTTFENRSVLTEEGGIAPVGIQPRSAEWAAPINKVWFGGSSTDLEYAKRGVYIDKKIDYKNNSIHWKVEFNRTKDFWKYPYFYVFMPHHTNVVEIHKNWGASMVKETDFDKNNRWNYPTGSQQYLEEFDNRVINHIPENDARMKEIKSNLNWFKDEKCSNVLISREGEVNSNATWEFTTEHEPGTVLEKVPMIAGSYGHTATNPFGWPRGLAVGTFGMAARHEIPIPETTYVNNPKDLTENEKKLVTKRVLEKVLEEYKRKVLETDKPEKYKKEIAEFFGENVRLKVNGRETTIRYEEYDGGTKLRLLDGAGREITDVNTIDLVKDSYGDPILKQGNKISIDKDGRFNIHFKDDTIGTLDPFLYVKEKELRVLPKFQRIMELQPIAEISVEALGSVVFENSIKVDESTPLPKGLTLTKNGNKAFITGTINDVVFPAGKNTVDYIIKIRADDPINRMSVVKEVKITVQKNPGLVPVGTNERGYDFPIKLLSLGFLLTVFSLYNIKKRKFD